MGLLRTSRWIGWALTLFQRKGRPGAITDQFRYDSRARARIDIVDWIEGFYNRVQRGRRRALGGQRGDSYDNALA
jgi:hypothetical protein